MNMGKTNKCNLKEDDTSEKVVKKYQWSGPFRKGILLHLHMPTHRQKHLINRMCKSTTNQLLIAYFDYTFILDDCLCLIKICAYSHITIIKACVRYFIKFLFFYQMIGLQKLWKMFCISSKKPLSLRYSIFCNFSLPFHTF